MVRQGYAYCFRYSRGEYVACGRSGFLAAEEEARRERLGVWSARLKSRCALGSTGRKQEQDEVGGHAEVRTWGALPLRLGWCLVIGLIVDALT